MKIFRKQIGHELPGGFHYHIPDGPTIKSESEIPEEAVKDLCDQLTAYRVNNGWPIGEPLDEITDWYAKNFPFCVENGDRETQKDPSGIAHDVIMWTNRQWKTPPKSLTDPENAHCRAAICLKCPFRDEVDLDDSPADKEAQRRVYLISRGMLLDNEVGWCSLHRWDNRLACLLPSPETSQTYSKCWLAIDKLRHRE